MFSACINTPCLYFLLFVIGVGVFFYFTVAPGFLADSIFLNCEDSDFGLQQIQKKAADPLMDNVVFIPTEH